MKYTVVNLSSSFVAVKKFHLKCNTNKHHLPRIVNAFTNFQIRQINFSPFFFSPKRNMNFLVRMGLQTSLLFFFFPPLKK